MLDERKIIWVTLEKSFTCSHSEFLSYLECTYDLRGYNRNGARGQPYLMIFDSEPGRFRDFGKRSSRLSEHLTRKGECGG